MRQTLKVEDQNESRGGGTEGDQNKVVVVYAAQTFNQRGRAWLIFPT